MDDFNLKEAIGAVKTYAKMVNDYAIEDGDGKEIIENTWYYYIENGTFIVTLICYGEEKVLKFEQEEWNHSKANMLANSKLQNLVREFKTKK